MSDMDTRNLNHASHGMIEILPRDAIPLNQAAQCLFCGARNGQLRDSPCAETPHGWLER